MRRLTISCTDKASVELPSRPTPINFIAKTISTSFDKGSSSGVARRCERSLYVVVYHGELKEKPN
jgi:hypothetical protein